MTRFLLLLPLLCTTLLSQAQAVAGEIKIPLVPLGWQIDCPGPGLKKEAFKYPEEAIQFQASGGPFNLSLFMKLRIPTVTGH